MKIRAVQRRDVGKVLELYHRSIDKIFPQFLYPKFLLHLSAGDCESSWVCLDSDGRFVGFASVSIEGGDVPKAVIRNISVHPEHQWDSVGRRLLEEVEKFVKSQDVKKIMIGPVVSDYFSLGVPLDSELFRFFAGMGFSEDVEFGYRPVWMTLGLKNWDVPLRFDVIREKLAEEGILLRVSNREDDMRGVLRVTKEYFPGWYEKWFKPNAYSDNPAPVSIAVCEGEVAGFVGPLWVRFSRYGCLGAVGVSPKFRRRGVGFAVMGVACVWWKENGAVQSDLWTGTNNPAVKLYRNLGFREIEVYIVLSKEV